MQNQELQESVLFDDSVSHINTSSNDSNIVHKQAGTSTISNNIEKSLNNCDLTISSKKKR